MFAVQGDERTDVLRDRIRDEGSIIKAGAEELDSFLQVIKA